MRILSEFYYLLRKPVKDGLIMIASLLVLGFFTIGPHAVHYGTDYMWNEYDKWDKYYDIDMEEPLNIGVEPCNA